MNHMGRASTKPAQGSATVPASVFVMTLAEVRRWNGAACRPIFEKRVRVIGTLLADNLVSADGIGPA
jgi:hypothetical protein